MRANINREVLVKLMKFAAAAATGILLSATTVVTEDERVVRLIMN